MTELFTRIDNPEPGWTRREETDKNVVYENMSPLGNGYASGSSTVRGGTDSKVTINFTGTKIRLYTMTWYTWKQIAVQIDNNEPEIINNPVVTQDIKKCLFYEKMDLPKGDHVIKVYCPEDYKTSNDAKKFKSFNFDCYDTEVSIGDQITTFGSDFKKYSLNFVPFIWNGVNKPSTNNEAMFFSKSKDELSLQFDVINTENVKLVGTSYAAKDAANVDIYLNGEHYESIIFDRISDQNNTFLSNIKLNKNKRYTIKIVKQASEEEKAIRLSNIFINKDGMVVAEDEVTKVEDLKIGKKIRAYLNRTQGEECNLDLIGKEYYKNGLSEFLQVSTKNGLMEGSLYLICVDKKGSNIILFPDRNFAYDDTFIKYKELGYVEGVQITPMLKINPIFNDSLESEGAKVFSDTMQNGDGLSPYFAFDDKSSTKWGSNTLKSNNEHFIGIQLPEKTKINGYKIVQNDSSYFINSYDFQGSNDGTNYDTIYSETFTKNCGYHIVSLEKEVEYLYYRLLVKSARNINLPSLSEFSLLKKDKSINKETIRMISLDQENPENNDFEKYILPYNQEYLSNYTDQEIRSFWNFQSNITSSTILPSNPENYVVRLDIIGNTSAVNINNKSIFRPLVILEAAYNVKHLLYHNGEYGYVKPGIGDAIPKMTSDTTPSGEVFASSFYKDSEMEIRPYRAFNKTNVLDNQDNWFANYVDGNSGNAYIGYDFKTPIEINELVLVTSNRTDSTGLSTTIDKFDFEGWDGSEWTLIQSVDYSSENVAIALHEKKISINNTKSYSKYRLNKVSSRAARQGTYGVSIGEIYMYSNTNWVSLGTTIPTQDQFEQYGTDDLTEWLPFINKLDGDKKIITSTDGELKGLNIHHIPNAQLIKQQDAIAISKQTLDTLTINTIGPDHIRVAVSFPDVDNQVYIYKDSTWSTITVSDATSFITSANTIDEMNAADWSTSPLNEKLQFIYSLEMKDASDAVALNNIEVALKGLVSSSPTISESSVNVKAYTLNGYLEELERNNTINFSKLEFKTDALMNAKKNKMHNMVIDTLQEDLLISSSGITEENKQTFTTKSVTSNNAISSIAIDLRKIISTRE